MSGKYYCMVMRLNIDCNACCKKARRIILKMKSIETHLIDKDQLIISVCGRFKPADVAIKLRKKMNRRVEILEIQEFDQANEEAMATKKNKLTRPNLQAPLGFG